MPIENEDREAWDDFLAVLAEDAPTAAEDAESILLEAAAEAGKVSATYSQYQALVTERGHVQAEIGIRQQEERYGEKHDPKWHAARLTKIAKLTARMEKITAARKARPPQFNPESEFVALATRSRGTRWKSYEGESPKSGDGLASFGAAKAARKTLLERQKEVINAPLPISVAKAQAEKDLAALARDAVSVTPLFMAKADQFGRVRQGRLRLPMIEISTDRVDSVQSIPDATALLAFACGDVIKKAVFNAIEAKAKEFTKPPLTEEQRKTKLAGIESALADSWYQIELGYRAAKAEGHDVVRPPRMPAEAVLLIVEDTSPRKAKSEPVEEADDDPHLAYLMEKDRKRRAAKKKAKAKNADWLG